MLNKIAKGIVKNEGSWNSDECAKDDMSSKDGDSHTKRIDDPIRKIVFSNEFDMSEIEAEAENGGNEDEIDYMQQSHSKKKKMDEIDIGIQLYDKLMKKVYQETKKEFVMVEIKKEKDDQNISSSKISGSMFNSSDLSGAKTITDDNIDVVDIECDDALGENDHQSIQRLVGLGFTEEYATMVYISCDKDENTAAMHLLTSSSS